MIATGKKRIIWVFYNQEGKLKRHLVQGSYIIGDGEEAEQKALELHAPSAAHCQSWANQGWKLSNWHVVEEWI